MEENAFDILDRLKNETEEIGRNKDLMKGSTDATRFIGTYIVELISFYNERYKEYKEINFDDVKQYLKHLRIRKNFTIEVKSLTMSETIEIINKKNPNLATLIKDTDISNRLSFPLDVTDDNFYDKADYLSKSLEDSMNIQDIKNLCKSSKNLFVIPSDENFIRIFFGKKKLMFMNYFESTKTNPLNNKPAQFVGDGKEIYRKAEILAPEYAVSIDNLALYHKKTKKRSIDLLVEIYKDFYEFITNSDNYSTIREDFYQYAKETHPSLCV